MRKFKLGDKIMLISQSPYETNLPLGSIVFINEYSRDSHYYVSEEHSSIRIGVAVKVAESQLKMIMPCFKFKYGDKVKLICNDPITTRFSVGDILTITDAPTYKEGYNAEMETISATDGECVQCCREHQVEFISRDITIDRCEEPLKAGDFARFINKQPVSGHFKIGDKVKILSIDNYDPLRSDLSRLSAIITTPMGTNKNICRISQLEHWDKEEILREEMSEEKKKEELPEEKEEPPKINEFPREGWCKSPTPEFCQYLRETFPHCKEVIPSYGGVAWNYSGYWGITSYSSKPIYQMKDLQQFIPPSSIMATLKAGTDTDIDTSKPSSFIGYDPFLPATGTKYIKIAIAEEYSKKEKPKGLIVPLITIKNRKLNIKKL